MNIKNQKGSITLFVLVSCLFFLASVACVNLYMQSKQVAVDREYRQIKANYEKDINNMNSIYSELSKKNNLSVNFGVSEINKTRNIISVNTYINLEYLNIKTLKYRWYYSNEEKNINSQEDINEILSNPVTNWTYVETQDGENEFIATCRYTNNTGYYYLSVMVDNMTYWNNNIIDISQE